MHLNSWSYGSRYTVASVLNGFLDSVGKMHLNFHILLAHEISLIDWCASSEVLDFVSFMPNISAWGSPFFGVIGSDFW